MIKKYSLYALVALLGAVSMDTGATLPSQISAVRTYVTGFITQWMGQLFTPAQRAFTTSYNITSDSDSVEVQRITSTMSISATRATLLFNQATAAIIDAILDIFDEEGRPAEGINVAALNNTPNAYRFTPYFMLDETDSEEDTEEYDDYQKIGEDDADTIPYKNNTAARAA